MCNCLAFPVKKDTKDREQEYACTTARQLKAAQRREETKNAGQVLVDKQENDEETMLITYRKKELDN